MLHLTLSPFRIQTRSPTTSCSASICRSVPARRTVHFGGNKCANPLITCIAFFSCRNDATQMASTTTNKISDKYKFTICVMSKNQLTRPSTPEARINKLMMFRTCRINSFQFGIGFAGVKRFNPFFCSNCLASFSSSPENDCECIYVLSRLFAFYLCHLAPSLLRFQE
jgi:hypothetical protein